MTESDLQELERLEKAATPGPWVSAWEVPDQRDPETDEGNIIYTANPDCQEPQKREVVHEFWCSGPLTGCTKPNAALIAASRNALPHLIAEIRRLRGAIREHCLKAEQGQPLNRISHELWDLVRYPNYELESK